MSSPMMYTNPLQLYPPQGLEVASYTLPVRAGQTRMASYVKRQENTNQGPRE
jgi:hypothetical protein